MNKSNQIKYLITFTFFLKVGPIKDLYYSQSTRKLHFRFTLVVFPWYDWDSIRGPLGPRRGSEMIARLRPLGHRGPPKVELNLICLICSILFAQFALIHSIRSTSFPDLHILIIQSFAFIGSIHFHFQNSL